MIGTASAHTLDFVRELGADEVIDYRTTRFDDTVRKVEANRSQLAEIARLIDVYSSFYRLIHHEHAEVT